MATVLRGGVVFVNGYDFSCFLQSMSETADVDMLDATPLCATSGRQFKPGLVARSFSGEAFYSVGDIAGDGVITADESKNIAGMIRAALGSTLGFHKITSGVSGGASGAPAVLYNADAAKGGVSSKVGDMMMISFDATAGLKSGVPAFMEGKWLYYGTTDPEVTSDSVDFAASHTGYFARIHNGSNLPGTYQIEHSTNNSTWVALGSGTVNANSLVELSSLVTTINRYVRVIVNGTGGAVDFGVAIVHGYAGAT